MLKIGNKVVCIDHININQNYTYKLKKYEQYTIKYIKYDDNNIMLYFILEECAYRYSADRFISVSEHRKNKLKKLEEYGA